ncbi:hypothetical protein OCU04_005955 [Sclerotinia nivalis]|uniref:Extracellular membrane protein CFEM domain-containing protein n=1 Tax=Sclerotinia nivalis TaxID=352851 RepID=A0A9X0ALZ1_9HELO|nr:hypothetical protein OCU04_005955 [Sclerotinia nivalis]
MNGNEVLLLLTGCCCCPLPMHVSCLNAPTGTRRCASEELAGCTCETNEDPTARFQRDFQAEGLIILVDGAVEQDLVEVNDDGLLDIQSSTQTLPSITRPTVSAGSYQIKQEHGRYNIGIAAFPTMGFVLRMRVLTVSAIFLP